MALGAIFSVSGDPLAGYTATMNFLCTPAGQLVVEDLRTVIVDLVKFFHEKHGSTETFNATVTVGTNTSKP